MDSCSTEIVFLISSFACIGPYGGRTARSLRLVSKYHHDIVAPLEFRSITISGPKQLEAAVARMRKEEASCSVVVQHLFVCDYSARHALALDTRQSAEKSRRITFEETAEGKMAIEVYRANKSAFWASVAELVRAVRLTLVTLSLLSFDAEPEMWNPFRSEAKSGIMSVLCGLGLPRLEALTVKHSVIVMPGSSPDEATSTPNMALSRCWASPSAPLLHPLLDKVHARHPSLTHLQLCTNHVLQVAVLENVVCGIGTAGNDRIAGDDRLEQTGNERSAPERLANGRLPGRLVSAELHVTNSPIDRRWPGERLPHHYKRSEAFKSVVDVQGIKGLKIFPPSVLWPEDGQREYELLLDEWRKQVEGVDILK